MSLTRRLRGVIQLQFSPLHSLDVTWNHLWGYTSLESTECDCSLLARMSP